MKKVYILFKDIVWEYGCCEVIAVYDNELECVNHFNMLMKDYDSFFDDDYYYWECYEIN